MTLANRYSYTNIDLIEEGLAEMREDELRDNDERILARLNELRPVVLVPYPNDYGPIDEYRGLLDELSPLCESADELCKEFDHWCGPYGIQWECELGYDA